MPNWNIKRISEIGDEKLNNERFVQNAKPEIVENERKKKPMPKAKSLY